MPIYFGQVIGTRSNAEYKCFSKECFKPIEKNSLYAMMVGKTKNHRITSRFHFICLGEYIEFKSSQWNEIRKSQRGEHFKQLIHKVKLVAPPEILRRRTTLLIYLNSKYKNKLINAYERQSNERVYKVMSLIYKTLIELESIKEQYNLPYTTSIFNTSDNKLTYYFDNCDFIWWHFYRQETELSKKYLLLLRDSNEWKPTWHNPLGKSIFESNNVEIEEQ